MCELHPIVPKSLQDVQDTSLAIPTALRKKFCFESNSIGNATPLSPRVLPQIPEVQRTPAVLRRKLWELERHYHCSVIGTCLTLAELRKIKRQLKGIVHALDTDYDLHRVFVVAVQEVTPATRLIHKFLERKYKSAIQKLAKMQPAVFSTYWTMALSTGEIAGAYWALITHPETPKNLLDQIYGEVHMLSHLSGATIRVDLQELNRLKRRCPELEAQLVEVQTTARRRLAEQQDIINALNQRLAQTLETEHKLRIAKAELATLEEQTQIRRLKTEITDLTIQWAAERDRADRAEAATQLWRQQASRTVDHHEWLAQQLTEVRHERDRLESTLERLLEPPDMGTHTLEFASSTGPDLVGRCVLYVGGRQNQCAHFRALVERCNGRFIHHDGGREDARAQLWDVVQQADAVLCPLDCVSHDAMHRVKRFCERTTKPLVLLPRASLAAFNRGLNAVALSELPS